MCKRKIEITVYLYNKHLHHKSLGRSPYLSSVPNIRTNWR